MRVCARHDLPGRPAKLTDDAIAAAEEFLSRGGPQSELAARLRVGRATWYRWLQEGEAAFEEGLDTQQARLYEAVRTAQAELQERCLASILLAGHGRIDPETRTREKGDWKALAWLLERRFPLEFGQRSAIDATLRPTSPLPSRSEQPEPLTTDEWGERFTTALRAIVQPHKEAE